MHFYFVKCKYGHLNRITTVNRTAVMQNNMQFAVYFFLKVKKMAHKNRVQKIESRK